MTTRRVDGSWPPFGGADLGLPCPQRDDLRLRGKVDRWGVVGLTSPFVRPRYVEMA
jgi:hypothetical protein